MKTFRKQLKRAKESGMSTLDFLKVQEIAKRESKKMEQEATEKAFLYMLAIPLNILVNDYWPKTAKRRSPKFISEVLKLYDAVENDIVSEEELAELLEDMAGIKITADWLKDRKGE